MKVGTDVSLSITSVIRANSFNKIGYRSSLAHRIDEAFFNTLKREYISDLRFRPKRTGFDAWCLPAQLQ